ncbi:uncharacterized protein LOC117339407 [Pecten maximus]|uniref:uncharacterized protein LOC117339407 n=1 Tax=Pecten maximus TaxID=6579 RepID=UPI0014590689|nr:uncharacterized protein LOC117339407 [Pecten maximus]
MPGWQGQDNVLNVRNLEGKSTTTQLYLPTDEIHRTQSYTIQQGQPEPSKSCKCGKCVIFVLFILVIGIVAGIYFAVMSSGKDEQHIANKTSIESNPSNDTYTDDKLPEHPKMKSTTLKPTTESTTEAIPTAFSDVISTADNSELLPIPTITGQDIILRSVGNIGQNNTDDPLFSTDPQCRNQENAAMFVFSCFNPHQFGNFPDNDTVKCYYVRQVGKCLELLVEERYRVSCNVLDQLYVFKSSADLIKKSVNFDVIVQCPEWWDYYNDALHNTTDTVNHTLS